MSIRVMTTVWDNFPGSGSELLVMLALADWCNDDGGSVHPSIATVAKKVRTSESQARRLIRGLIEKGWVQVVGNEFGGAPGATRQYRVNVQKIAAAVREAETGCMDARGSADATPRMGARDGSHGCAETGSTGATQSTTLSINDPPSSLGVPKPKPARKSAPKDSGNPQFDLAMSEYPKRAGGDSRVDARKAWDARIKAGRRPEDIIDGVKRYAAYTRARGKEHTEYVKRASTFFGPGEHWLGDYEIPKDNQGGQQNGRNGASGGARRESEAERIERVNREHDERERAAGLL